MGKNLQSKQEYYSAILSEKLAFCLLTAACGMLLVFSLIKNPAVYTISLVGVNYPTLFVLVCTVMSFACMTNMFLLFRKTDFHSIICNVLTVIANIAMVAVAFTAREDYVSIVTPIHWICAFLFMGVNPVMILMCIIHCVKKGMKRFYTALIVFPLIYAADVAITAYEFIKLGPMTAKNGLMELVPMFMIYIMLFLFNHTKVFIRENSDEYAVNNELTKQSAEGIIIT